MSYGATHPCIRDLAVPALREARDELVRTTRYNIELDAYEDWAELRVTDPEGDTFRYGLTPCAGCSGTSPDCRGLGVDGSPAQTWLACAGGVESVRGHCLEICRHWLLC